MNIIVFGHGRHGKDTVSKLICDYTGMSFISSSEMANQHFLFDKLKSKYGYKSAEECYSDRHNHRQEWYEAIRDFNTPDKTRLAGIIFGSHEIYCGIRDEEEFLAIRAHKMCDLAIWVDASERVALEPESSMKLTKRHADIILDNNGSFSELETKVSNLVRNIIL